MTDWKERAEKAEHDAAELVTEWTVRALKAEGRYDRLMSELDDIIYWWEWCHADPADRGYRPLSDAMENAKILLSAYRKEESV